MRNLSKSKLMAFRQCPRRVWLEVHRPGLKADTQATEQSYQTGYSVGEVARKLYDPQGMGVTLDVDTVGFPAVFDATQQLLPKRRPLFEAAFQMPGALALADVLLPQGQGWRMVEVKSSTSVKDVQLDDIAVQTHIARQSGLNLKSVAIAHVNNDWVYPGEQDYQGLLTEVDVSEQTFARASEAQQWILDAQSIVARTEMPEVRTGAQCGQPYACGFHNHCASLEPQAEMPLQWLPRFRAQPWVERGVLDMRALPDDALNPVQQRVRDCTARGEIFFDRHGATQALAEHPLPGYFLDFETIQFAVPIWAGTRPYQQIPFQWSLHFLTPEGTLDHVEFLDLSGRDPSKRFAESLIAQCGKHGPVFVYNAAFEKTRIRELAERFPALAKALQAIDLRIVDLLPIARAYYYHPSQKGSWSIKAVLPAIAPELSYDNLNGVQDGGMAQEAFLEAIAPQTAQPRKVDLRRQLLEYCKRDTLAMVRLWEVFSGEDPRAAA
ncbi:MAG: DUF2779 domain-containing protein [Betaproteobacteria bacterium]|nr:DUF2779 domain-containing protein [Betaproteobacteria bacterium]